MPVDVDVLFLPDYRSGNPYQEQLAEGLRATGLRVTVANYPGRRFALLSLMLSHRSMCILHLHWVHPYMRRILLARSPLRARLAILVMVLDVLAVRLCGIKVLWTVHNLVSHECPDIRREQTARRWLARVVNRLVFHSVEACRTVEAYLACSLECRAEVIPHGHYLHSYQSDTARERRWRQRLGLADEDIVLLCFGYLRRYKAVGQLLEAFAASDDQRLRLVIAGEPFDPSIVEEIHAAADRDPRIRLHLEFVSVADIAPLYGIAQAAILPAETALTSGSAILAMSQGKALLLSEQARAMTGLPPTPGLVCFDNQDGFRARLRSLADMDLDAMGAANRLAIRVFDWNAIGVRTARIYRALEPVRMGALITGVRRTDQAIR